MPISLPSSFVAISIVGAKRLFLSVLLVISACSSIKAAELGFESGYASHFLASPQYATSAKYDAITLRYGNEVYIEGLQSGWSGINNARFTAISIGFRSSSKWFAESSLGYGILLTPNTILLDGDRQFILSAGIGVKIDNLRIIYKYRHLSNVNTQGDNIGTDFKIISLSVEF